MKKMLFSAVAFAVVAVSAVAVAPTTSEAVPSFARQTGAACLNCHFQAIPRLTTFGRNFSMTGMRDMGEQALLEDDHMSLPASFNGSFLMKGLISHETDLAGTGQSLGLQIPDESALFVGGRYGEMVGALTKIVMNGTSVDGASAGVAQAKFNVVVDTDFGHVNIAIVTGNDGLGVLFSDPSNAVRDTNRAAIKRGLALKKSAMMNQGVSGVGISTLINDSVYLGVAGYAPSGPVTNPLWGSLNQLSPYVRAAYIAEVGGLEAVVGGWYVAQKPVIHSRRTAAKTTLLKKASAAKQYGVDLQLQGDVGGMSVGFYLPWVIKGEQEVESGKITNNITGYQAMLTIGLGHAGVKLGYDYMKNKNIVAATSVTTKRPYIGAWYSLAQNVELELAYTRGISSAGVANVNNTTLVVEYVY